MFQPRWYHLALFFLTAMLILAAPVHADETSDQTDDWPVLTGPYLGQKPPGGTAELFAPEIISTCREHSAAMFTPDGSEIWFGRIFPGQIFVMKMMDGQWTEPQLAPFSDTYNYLYPALSQDGSRVFLTSDRPLEQNSDRLPRGERHIWMVERVAEGWSEPQRLSDKINRSRRNSCGSTAANGSLYFTVKDDARSTEICRSILVGGTYSEPEYLTKLNSPTPEHSPFVASDESYLIFSSFRGGYGRSDLFITFRDPDGWTEPKNLGPRINSPYKDEYPFATADGKYLFFNSNRPSPINRRPIPNGPGNIYWVNAQIIEELKPDELK